MSTSNNPKGQNGPSGSPESPPRSVRESAIKLLADLDTIMVGGRADSLIGLTRSGKLGSMEQLRRSLQEPEFSRAELLPDAPWAIEGIEIMKAQKPGLLPIHIKAIVAAAEAGLQAHGSFQLRWAADMRAIERWKRGDLFSSRTRALLERALAELRHAHGAYSDDECGEIAAELEQQLKIAEPGGRDLIMPDHADLVVWLLELLDCSIDCSFSVGAIEQMISRVGRAGLWHASQGSAHGDSIPGEELARMLRELLAQGYSAERRCLQAEVRGVKAGRLLIEAARLFREFQAHHEARAMPSEENGPYGVRGSLEKASRNAAIAERIEALIPALDVPEEGQACRCCGDGGE